MESEHHRVQNGWNFAFSVFFAAMLMLAVSYLASAGRLPQSVPVWDAILMAFATFRISRLIVYDRIARWFRELFNRKNGGFFETVRDLLECPWCVGVWAALIVIFCYQVFDWGWFVIFFLALAGAGSLLQVVANMIGWRAETLKMEAKEKGSL